MAFLLAGLAACSSNKGQTGALADGSRPDSTTLGTDAGTDGGCNAGDPGSTYVLIDDMETTTHGPIEFDTGIAAPLTQGYWYNSGSRYSAEDAGLGGSDDTSSPPQGSFVFSALSTPTQTLNCKSSSHAAHQSCALNGLYDTCGVGFEFAQVPDGDAGAGDSSDAAASDASDAGDAGPSIPRTTVPFDISRYKAVTFWGMTTLPDPVAGYQTVKIQFPDTDTDPRGEVCNGGGGNTSKCYNSYATYLKFTSTWQQFTVLLDAGTDGIPPDGGIAIDQTWGYQQAQWIPTQVYGINWQTQKNTAPDAGAPFTTDIWIDDVYFVE